MQRRLPRAMKVNHWHRRRWPRANRWRRRQRLRVNRHGGRAVNDRIARCLAVTGTRGESEAHKRANASTGCSHTETFRRWEILEVAAIAFYEQLRPYPIS